MRPQHFFAGILILGLMTIWEAEFFVLDILPCLKAKAAEYQTEYQDVVINELMWMGSKDDNPTNHTNDEWIELKNTTDQEINISNWQIYEAITGSGGYLEIPNGYSIPANGYFLIANYNKDGSAINVDVDLVDTDISLHNNYDDNGALVLKDKDGNVVDSTPTPTNTIWPAGSNGTIKQSMERDTRGETWHTCDIAFMTAAEVSTMQSYWDSNAQNYNCGTPKTENSKEEEEEEPESPPEEPPTPPEDPPSPIAPNVIINELFPNPKGEEKEQEFIELKNLSEFVAYLIGWQIKDKSGKTYEFILEKIPPQGLLALFYEQSKIQLNNTGGEEVTLYDNFSNPINSIPYQDAEEGYSYNFTEQGWLWSSTPTPEDINSITQKNEEQNSPQIAYPRHIWISEFLPNPKGSDTENEFIEIYNQGPDEINLENWQIDDCENKGSHPHTFPENKKIAAGEYLSLPYSETKIALNNDEDCVRLLWPGGIAIDEIAYENPPENESYNKINDRWCWSASLTPGEQNNCSDKNSEEETKEYSRRVWINEFLPDPEGKDTEAEFIELQNRGDENIDLNAWQIDDCENIGSKPYTFPEDAKIEADGYLALNYQNTKINLNNDGDCVRLITPEGQTIDEIEYNKAPEGQSYSRKNVNHWQWAMPSPGQDNDFPQVLAAAATPTPLNPPSGPLRQSVSEASMGETAPKSPLLPQTGPNFYIYIPIAVLLKRATHFTFKNWGVKIKAELGF